MPEITVGDVAALLELGISTVWKDELKLAPETWRSWLDDRPAKRFTDYDMLTSGVGAGQEKPPGSPFQTDRIYLSPKKSFTLKPYGIALVIQAEVIKYEWYNVIAPLGGTLARALKYRYEVSAYSILERAFDTSDPIYTDVRGEALCKTDHIRLDGGTWKNRSSDDIGLSMDGLEQAWEDLRTLTNHRGFFGDVTPKRLIVAPRQRWLANILTMSATDPDNAHLMYNNAKAMGLTVMDSPHLSDPFPWFVLSEKSTYNIHMGMGQTPDLKSAPIPATRSIMWTSYCAYRIEEVEGKGLWGSRGQ